MRKILFGMLMAAMSAGLVSCVNDDTDLSDIIAQYQVQPVDIEFDYSALIEADDVPVTDENDSAYNDYVENTQWSKVIEINYQGATVEVNGSVPGVMVSTTGAHVTVINMSGPVKFVLSGTTTDGSFKLYGDKRCQMLLNGVSIVNPNGAAINNQGGKSLYMVLADGTVNALQDGSNYSMVDEEDQKAALFSEGQIIFSGKGQLDVTAVGRGGIRSDDYIRLRPGVKIRVNSSALDGMRANDGIIIDGGVINIEATGVGAKGVRSGGPMTVNGGRLISISNGDTRIETVEAETDTNSCAALYCDTLLLVNNGVVKLKATGDGGKGINAKYDVTINDGSVEAVATGTRNVKKPKGVKIDGNFAISGGYFYSYSRRSDPMEVAGTTRVSPGYKTYDIQPRLITIAY